jgi:hypothetical protein
MGQILAGPNFDDKCILTADLEMDEITRAKYHLDVAGHYARPDIFCLFVNALSTPPVVSNTSGVEILSEPPAGRKGVGRTVPRLWKNLIHNVSNQSYSIKIN